MTKNILVTGGAGYIGSHTCKTLAHHGFIPITYDNLSNGHAYAVQWGPLIHADLRDTDTLHHTLTTYRPLAVLHFASDAYVVESTQNPGKYYSNNVVSTLNLLQAMHTQHIPNLIFSSSCATYGQPATTPISETQLQHPINPYGRTKLICEQMIADFHQAHQLNYVSLRYFNAAGADLETQIGEDHTPETHLIPNLIHAILFNKPFHIYGTDFPTPDGTAIRDYTHVQDLANAHLLALNHLLNNGPSLALNLGTGTGHSVLQILRTIERYFDKSLIPHNHPRRPGEPAILTADPALAHRILGWAPQHSDLETLIATASRWFEKRRNASNTQTAVN
ncbi:MAG: UDP-glucose 4-epimerase GalE [Chlamydiia bacterium]|nr:UDP-glucose 4-epimerase GalE [Chlamydiia bacterium]